ncbi:MAG: class F sortase, partial [Actinobacteria bacterium]|nr:class F sortase [Actinomycetota bacterium]
SYQVAPDQPRFIAIDSINVFARVKHIGRTQPGNIGAPTNIHDTSWFTSSTPPGEDEGSSIITGHVGRDRYNGVFYDLPKVRVGDEVMVTKGDGSVIKYVVENTETVAVSKIRMGDYLGHARQDKPKLHLITCVGTFDSELLSFTDRLVVSATEAD